MGSGGGLVILWELARASAFVAFACYTLVVRWRVVLAGRAWRPAAPQLSFHRFLSSLGLLALGLHVSCRAARPLRPSAGERRDWCGRPPVR